MNTDSHSAATAVSTKRYKKTENAFILPIEVVIVHHPVKNVCVNLKYTKYSYFCGSVCHMILNKVTNFAQPYLIKKAKHYYNIKGICRYISVHKD